MSLLVASDPESLQSFAGDVLTKEVGVSVTLKDGKEKPFVFTLLRYALTTPDTNRMAQARGNNPRHRAEGSGGRQHRNELTPSRRLVSSGRRPWWSNDRSRVQ